MAVKEYNDDSIEVLEGATRVRNAPHNFLGSNKIDGARQTIKEIVGNSTDERLSGFGDDLEIHYYEDGGISVRDYGRGVPLGYNSKKKKWNYFLIYEELFAGAKYDNNQEILHEIDNNNQWGTFNFKDYPYMISIGMHGVGGACTQYTSEYFEVISYRDGKASRMYYEKGRHVLDELEVTDTTEKNGTFVKWKPDIEVFEDVNIGSRWLDRFCRTLSMTSGFNVHFTDDKKGTSVTYEGKDIKSEMNERCNGEYASNKFIYHCTDSRGDICVCEAEAVIGSGVGKPEFYHNMLEMSGGSHSIGLDSALYTFFLEVGKGKGLKVKSTDYAGKLSVIVTTLANKMSVHGQTKDFVDDEYIQVSVANCIYDMLKREQAKGTKWLEEVIDDVVMACEVRVAQEEIIKNNKEIEKAIKKHKVSEKFTSCETYESGDVAATEWFIVEGDSAGGRVKTAKSDIFQCILPIRGKSLNLYKASVDQMVSNREIQDMISVLGCGIDLGIDGYETFNINRLKVGNIYFLADADIDGKHINMLLFLIFYKLFPELLYQGKVWVIDSPLYVINTKSNECLYCMDEEELARKKEEYAGRIRSVNRFKGLGETDAEMLWETTLNPETRRARQIKIERNDTDLTDVLEVLFGRSSERRKQAILGSMIEDFDTVMDDMESIDDYVKKIETGLSYEEVVL